MTPRALWILSSALAFAGCTGEPKDPPAEADADGDTDADTDADSDTDTDTDTDVGPLDDVALSLHADDAPAYATTEATVEVVGAATISGDAIAGEVSYLVADDEGAICDGSIALSGSAYTGDCNDCAFAFDVIPEDAAGSAGACDWDWGWSLGMLWRNAQYGEPTRLAYWDTFEWPYYYYYYGGYEDYGDGDTGPGSADAPSASYGETLYGAFGYGYAAYWSYGWYDIVAHQGDPDTSFSRTGDALAWSWIGTETTYTTLYAEWCGGYGYGTTYAQGSYLQDTDHTSTLPCTEQDYGWDTGGWDSDASDTGGWEDGPDEGWEEEEPYMEVLDVWSFEATAGQTFYVTVDTVSAETAFDPAMWLNGPDGCYEAQADDTFPCTYPPPSFECPSIKHTADATGTWQVVVEALGSCASDTAEYAIDVRTDPAE